MNICSFSSTRQDRVLAAAAWQPKILRALPREFAVGRAKLVVELCAPRFARARKKVRYDSRCADAPPMESPANEKFWVQQHADLCLVSVFSAAAVVLVRMFPSSPSLCYYRGSRGEEDFRALVLLHHDRRFVQPMLHTSICKYTPGHSRDDIH